MTLLFVGPIVTVLAFYVNKAASFPKVLAVVAPRYAGALRGLTVLEQRRTLSETADGFSDLASYIVSGLTSSDGRPPSSDLLARFELGTAMIAFGQTHAGEHVPFRIFVKGQEKPIEADLALVRQAVSDAGNAGLLTWSVVFVVIGFLISMVAGGITAVHELSTKAS